MTSQEDSLKPDSLAEDTSFQSIPGSTTPPGRTGKTTDYLRLHGPGFWNPYRIILSFFIGLILTGGGLLLLPFSTNSGQSPTIMTALFTSTSAVCVTGLVVVDTASYWSGFGQVVILLLMQLGGLGFASSSVLFLVALDRRLDLNERLVLKSAIGSISRGSVLKLSLFILSITLICETVGAAVLFLGWVGQHGVAKAAWWAVFHSVSAFTNASFDITGTPQRPFASLIDYNSNYLVSLTIPILIILGGIGFIVIAEILEFPGSHRLSVHARIVVGASLFLIAGGTFFIWLAEHNNPLTLGGLSLPDQVVAAFFQSVCPRTAGFTTINVAAVYSPTLLLMMTLMFIGGASGSTAGGIKVGTVVVVMASIRSILLGRSSILLFKKSIPARTVEQALAIGALYTFGIGLVIFLISLFESLPLRWIAFEVVSAFGTVGMSLGATPHLTFYSLALLIAAMFIGRLGPILLVVALSRPGRNNERVKYPEEDIAVG